MSRKIRCLLLSSLVVLAALCGGCGKRECPTIGATGQSFHNSDDYHVIYFRVEDESLIESEPYVVFSVPLELTVFAGEFVAEREVKAGSAEAKCVRQALQEDVGLQKDAAVLELLDQPLYIGTAYRDSDGADLALPEGYGANFTDGTYYGAFQADTGNSADVRSRLGGYYVVFGDDCARVRKLY